MSSEPLPPDVAELFRREPIPKPPPEAAARVLTRLSASVAVGGAGVLGTSAIKLAALTFVIGAALGGGAVATLRSEPAPRVVYVDRPTTPPAVTPIEVAATAPPVTSASVAPPVRSPASAAPSTRESLGSERALLDEARARLTSGEAELAIRRLDEHARRYPHPILDEEREALAVQALVNAGRFDEARARAAAFSARWPDSVYEPAVTATLKSIP